MAHPFSGDVKRGNIAKFKNITGKKSSGQAHSDEAQDKALFKKMIKSHDRGEYKVGGAVTKSNNFARGGRSKGKGKGGTKINIMVMGGKDKEAASPMPPPPMAPMAPPPGAGPGGPPPGGPPGGMPTGGLPGMNRGGKVKMKGGAESGVGRLDKVKAYKRG